MNNVVNQVPYLRTSREFPEELHQLTVEMNKTYIDIANAVNNRTISIFPTNRPAITGERWFFNQNNSQQTLRQIYTFTSTAAITHGLNINDSNQFTKCSGSYTNGTNSYGLLFASSVAISGQITFYITSTQIIFVSGAGAPSLIAGRIVLEYLSSI